MKRILQDILFVILGMAVGFALSYIVMTMTTMTIFEDGSFVGCLQYFPCWK